MSKKNLPDWDRVLSSAARLQGILPEAVLVGGTASAIYAQHRFSQDSDHVLSELRTQFKTVLAELESVAGWKTARIQRPVQILGSLDGIETGIRQLSRSEPLQSRIIDYHGKSLHIPTENEILRIKGILILKHNATRDYLDFVALADHMGNNQVINALKPFDHFYLPENGESPLQQLQIQLANPLPFDLDEVEADLSEYKSLDPKWHQWSAVKTVCVDLAVLIFDSL